MVSRVKVLTSGWFPAPISSSCEIVYFHVWQTLYLAAMMEADNTKLFPKLNEAAAAIFNRLQALSTAKNCQEERTAPDDAIRSLRVLKRDQLGFPDWT